MRNCLCCLFLLTRGFFLSHFSLKPAVVCQRLSKLMFTFVIWYTESFNAFFLNDRENKIFEFLLGEHSRGGNFQKEYRGKKVLINKVFDLTHKQNIKITREAITPIVYTLRPCTSKYFMERLQRQYKNWPKRVKKWYYQFWKSCRTITGYGGDTNL